MLGDDDLQGVVALDQAMPLTANGPLVHDRASGQPEHVGRFTAPLEATGLLEKSAPLRHAEKCTGKRGLPLRATRESCPGLCG
jgi:hypothetical protein